MMRHWHTKDESVVPYVVQEFTRAKQLGVTLWEYRQLPARDVVLLQDLLDTEAEYKTLTGNK